MTKPQPPGGGEIRGMHYPTINPPPGTTLTKIFPHSGRPMIGKPRNLGTFPTRAAAEKHERAVQYFKHH